MNTDFDILQSCYKQNIVDHYTVQTISEKVTY